MDYLLTAIVFFVIFSAIILIHEGGHFWAARLGKIKIEEFGFGLPPRLWGWKNKKSKIIYSINWIPFGGFVRMFGEDDPDNKKAQKDPHAFNNRPLLVRAFAISAGVIMNFILGWLLLTFALFLGMQPIFIDLEKDIPAGIESGVLEIDDSGVHVRGVIAGSPAERAQILPDDIITNIDTTAVQTADDFMQVKDQGLRGKEFHLSILRREYDENANIIAEKQFVALVAPDEKDQLGLLLSANPRVIKVNDLQYPLHIAAVEAVKELGRLMYFTVKLLGDVVAKIFTQLAVPDNVGGPVAIAQITHQFVSLGSLAEILKLAAILSISIGVLNIMPFPALDGGRLLFIIGEMVTGRKPNAKWETVIHGTGFFLLIGLLVLVTWNDILRIVTG